MLKKNNVKKIMKSPAAASAGAFLLSLGAGWVLSGANVAGAASFADVSLAGGLNLSYSAAVFTGGLVRSIIQGSVGRNIVKITAALLIVIVKMFVEPKNDPKICGISAFCAVFASGAAVSAVIGELLYKLIFYLLYAALAGYTAYSIALIISGFRMRRAADLCSASGCSYAVVYTLMIASLCSVELPIVNGGIALGAAVTLAGAYFYRYTGGVLCGALTTCGAFLSSTSCGMTVVLLPAAGLLTGYLYRQRINVAAGFFTGLNFMLMILTGVNPESMNSMFNIVCGTAIFRFLAPYYSDKWIITGDASSAAFPEILCTRMSFLSDSIGNLRTESEKIAGIISENAEKKDEIPDNSNDVCSRCFRRLNCWKNDYDNTVR